MLVDQIFEELASHGQSGESDEVVDVLNNVRSNGEYVSFLCGRSRDIGRSVFR